MALNFNSVEPTQIIAKDGASVQTFIFPSGARTTDIFMSDITGYNTAQATFTSTHNFTANMVICNGIVLNSSDKLIHQETTKTDIEDDDYLTWSFYASFKDNVISLEQIAQRRFKKELNLTSVTLHGKTYSAGFYGATDLTVLKYSVKEADLSGEATRASVSSYSKAALDGYVGLVNDTWGGITNASSLIYDKYYYIRVLVTDTNKYGKFCVRFKSANGQTITTDNIGWNYDGEFITAIPVWGKPFSLTIQVGANSTVSVNRTSSPNQHAATGAITSGGIVYYGDTLTITATPASGYKLTKFTINGTEYASGQTSAVSQTITVTSAVSVVINTGSAGSWHTIWSGSASSNIQDNQSTDILCRGVTGYDISRRTRVTGSTGTRYSIAFNNKEIGEYIYYSNDNINIKFSGIKSTPAGFATSFVSKNTGTTIYLTKIEQYY